MTAPNKLADVVNRPVEEDEAGRAFARRENTTSAADRICWCGCGRPIVGYGSRRQYRIECRERVKDTRAAKNAERNAARAKPVDLTPEQITAIIDGWLQVIAYQRKTEVTRVVSPS